MQSKPILNKTALLVIDVQNDFCEGGAMATERTLDVIPIINRICDMFDMVIYTKDEHFIEHKSFKCNGGPHPIHCIYDTFGSEIHKLLNMSNVNHYIVHKGHNCEIDKSCLSDATNVKSILKHNKIECVYLCGLGINHCIQPTLVDMVKLRYKCVVIIDAIGGSDEEIKKLKDLCCAMGIVIMCSNELIA